MKRPLGIVALFYSAGILAGDHWMLPLFALFPLAFLCWLLALSWSQPRNVLLCAVFFLAGGLNLTLRTTILSPEDLRLLLGQRSESVTLQGILRRTSKERIFLKRGEEKIRSVAEVDVAAIGAAGEWRAARGRVVVGTPDILPRSFFSGQPVEISGVIHPPSGPMAPGLFDYREYLRRKGIYYQLNARSSNDWRLASFGSKPVLTSPPLPDQFFDWAKKTLSVGLAQNGDDEFLSLLWAMTLDWKTPMTDEVEEPFLRAGTYHIFAVDGLRMGIISGIVLALLRALRVPRAWCGVILLPALWFYAGMTGWSAAAIRSTIMMTIIVGGWALERPPDLLNSLFSAALIILLIDPQQLFQSGFQLSFLVVMSLALMLPPLEILKERCFKPDPFLPEQLIPRWRTAASRVGTLLFGLIAVSIAAWIGSIPLSAYYFNLFSPASVPANVMVVPLTMLALISNLAGLIAGIFFPALAELFNSAAWLFMKWISNISQWAAALPGGSFHVKAPSPWWICFYYGALVAWLGGFFSARKTRWFAIAALGAMLTGGLIQVGNEFSETRLSILPAGGGGVVYVDAPRWKSDSLINCGNDLWAESLLKPFLRAQGVDRLPALVLTGFDTKHAGASGLVRSNFTPIAILAGHRRPRSPDLRAWIEESASKSDGGWTFLQGGDRTGLWSVLHPAADDRFSQGSDSALVLLGQIYQTRILLLSDLGRNGQRALLSRGGELRADIVVTGLPGRNEALLDDLLDAIQPAVIVITDDEFPAQQRAPKELKARLAERSLPVFYGREQGAMVVSIRPHGWSLQSDGRILASGPARK